MPRILSAFRPRRAIGLALALGAAGLFMAFLLLSPTFQVFLEQAIDWAEGIMSRHPVLGAVVFFLFSVLSAMLAFASSTVLVVPADLAWGKPITFLLLWGGWLAGAVVAFGIGRLAGPLLLHGAKQEKLGRYRQYVSERMKFWMVLLLCIAVPSEIPGYLFGSTGYSFPKFLAAMAIAEAGYALGTVIAGESLLVDKPLPFLATISLLIVVTVLAGVVLRIMGRRKAADRLSPP